MAGKIYWKVGGRETQNIWTEQESKTLNSEMRKENQILLFLFILLQCHIGHALKCHSCIGNCTDVKTIECGAAEDQCVTWKQLAADGSVQGQQKGCVKSQDCNANDPNTLPIIQCCNTDLCNADNTTNTTSTTSAPTAPTAPTVSNTTREPGSPLRCNSCELYGCQSTTPVTCKPYQLCVTKYTTIYSIPTKKYGCADATICSKNTTEDIIIVGTVFVKNTCCNEDYCNLAVTLKLSSITTIGAVLLLWITKLC